MITILPITHNPAPITNYRSLSELFNGGYMLPLNIEGEAIFLKDITNTHLPLILKWYNEIDEFKYATGIESPITLEMLSNKFDEDIMCDGAFFSGIYISLNKKMIGILKGIIQPDKPYTAWINQIAIDTSYRGRGYGSRAIDMLLEYLKNNYYIEKVCLSVMEMNKRGINFWSQKSFEVLKTLEKTSEQNKEPEVQKIMIMYKNL